MPVDASRPGGLVNLLQQRPPAIEGVERQTSRGDGKVGSPMATSVGS